jgi:lipoate-protein ligase A
MAHSFRMIDSGVQDGRMQIAFDQALIDLHKAGRVPDTVRFLRFPPTVLVGRHQAMWHEVKIEDCLADGIGLVRRITGGGTIYLEENQVGWELVLSRKRLPMPTLGDYTRAICEAVAHGLSVSFGIDARYRPRNDIEVDGRKICGTGGFFDGDTLIYQGTTLVDVDPARVMAYLNIPEAKLKKRDLDKAENRVTTLKALIGRAPAVEEVKAAVLRGLKEKLDIDAKPAAVAPFEMDMAKTLHDEEIGTDEFVFSIDEPRGADVAEASVTGAGGTVSAFLRTEGAAQAQRIREILLTGDFFVTPPRMIFDLESSLRGVLLGDAGPAVDRFFAATKPDLLTIAPADFRRVVEDAVAAALRA